MADKISGYDWNGVDPKSTKTRGPDRNKRAAEGDKAEAAKQTTNGSTAGQVPLTDTAANLKQVQARIADLPGVDRARVGALRRRVESGAYQINAGRLADRLLAFERYLNRHRLNHC